MHSSESGRAAAVPTYSCDEGSAHTAAAGSSPPGRHTTPPSTATSSHGAGAPIPPPLLLLLLLLAFEGDTAAAAACRCMSATRLSAPLSVSSSPTGRWQMGKTESLVLQQAELPRVKKLVCE